MKKNSEKQCNQNDLLLKVFQQSLLKTHGLINSFIIFGSPARKSNSRIFTGTAFILGKSAQKFINLFVKQWKKLFGDKEFLYDVKYGTDCFWLFEMWYNNKSADTSIELLFDLLQHNKVIDNDVNIRSYYVHSNLDYFVPRVKVSIYKPLTNS